MVVYWVQLGLCMHIYTSNYMNGLRAPIDTAQYALEAKHVVHSQPWWLFTVAVAGLHGQYYIYIYIYGHHGLHFTRISARRLEYCWLLMVIFLGHWYHTIIGCWTGSSGHRDHNEYLVPKKCEEYNPPEKHGCLGRSNGVSPWIVHLHCVHRWSTKIVWFPQKVTMLGWCGIGAIPW